MTTFQKVAVKVILLLCVGKNKLNCKKIAAGFACTLYSNLP